MLHKAGTLKGYKLGGLDGEAGKVEEFYFDDRFWAVRYLVADTGEWLTGRQVLIAPHVLGAVNTKEQAVAVNLTQEQIELSPALSRDEPVSRQYQESYYRYYGMPIYWGGRYMWGMQPFLLRDSTKWEKESRESEEKWDPNLRSTRDVTGHHIEASDGDIGHVEDFIIDDETWAIRYLVIDTRNWWPGKHVLISPKWIERISWDDQKVYVNVQLESIKQAPEYTEDSLPSRDYEAALHEHYHLQGYWRDEQAGGKR